jgi:hypothetical protein
LHYQSIAFVPVPETGDRAHHGNLQRRSHLAKAIVYCSWNDSSLISQCDGKRVHLLSSSADKARNHDYSHRCPQGDECDDKNSIGQFVEIVIGAFRINLTLPLRIMFASRIEKHIRRKLETSAACSVVHHLSLQDFGADRVIWEFFRSSFTAIYEENHPLMRNVPLPWPCYPQ